MLMYAENNEAKMLGSVVSPPVFSHEVHTEKFYRFHLACERLSENCDIIPITVSERLWNPELLFAGKKIEVNGQFRSYNNYSGEGSRLVLTLFAKEIREAMEEEAFENEIYLNGYICKPVVYRVTPFGREIADILLAVNRAYRKSDYIPCIAWGRNAKYAEALDVGTNIKVFGRMQSRAYQKRLSDEETVEKIAYEVSVGKLESVKSIM